MASISISAEAISAEAEIEIAEAISAEIEIGSGLERSTCIAQVPRLAGDCSADPQAGCVGCMHSRNAVGRRRELAMVQIFAAL